MTTLYPALSLLLIMPVLAPFAQAIEKSRPMEEMHGGCENYQLNLKKEFELWEQKPAAHPAEAKLELPLGKRLDLQLKNEASVKFAVKPKKSSPEKEKAYGGNFRVKPDFDGTLRISAGNKLWFDLVEPGKKEAVPSENFEMQTKCEKILKAVEFPVRKGVEYALQVSGSKKETAGFLLSQRP